MKVAPEKYWTLKKKPVDAELLDGLNGHNGLVFTILVDQKNKRNPLPEVALNHKATNMSTLLLMSTLLSCLVVTIEPESTLQLTPNVPTSATNVLESRSKKNFWLRLKHQSTTVKRLVQKTRWTDAPLLTS